MQPAQKTPRPVQRRTKWPRCTETGTANNESRCHPNRQRHTCAHSQPKAGPAPPTDGGSRGPEHADREQKQSGPDTNRGAAKPSDVLCSQSVHLVAAILVHRTPTHSLVGSANLHPSIQYPPVTDTSVERRLLVRFAFHHIVGRFDPEEVHSNRHVDGRLDAVEPQPPTDGGDGGP